MFEHLEKRTLFSADLGFSTIADHLEPTVPIDAPAVVDEAYWPEEAEVIVQSESDLPNYLC